MPTESGPLDAAPSKTTPPERSCRACRHTIPAEAILCQGCGTYQNRLRAALPHLEAFAGVALAIIVLLPSVFTWWGEWAGQPEIEFRILNWVPESVTLSVENSGHKSVSLSHLKVFPKLLPDIPITTIVIPDFVSIPPGDLRPVRHETKKPNKEKHALNVFELDSETRARRGFRCTVALYGTHGVANRETWCSCFEVSGLYAAAPRSEPTPPPLAVAIELAEIDKCNEPIKPDKHS